VHNADYYNWCVTPNTSYDVTLFGGLAVVLACLLQGKLNTLMVLCAGGRGCGSVCAGVSRLRVRVCVCVCDPHVCLTAQQTSHTPFPPHTHTPTPRMLCHTHATTQARP
jgi:hypothetical protein